MERNWKEYNQKLVERGEIYLDERALRNAERELKRMNKKKEGHPFEYPDTLIKLLGIIKVKFRLPYRMAIGLVQSFARLLLSPIHIPDYTSLFRRMNNLKLEISDSLPGINEPLFITIDSSGLKADNGGTWIEQRFGRKKRHWIKIHFAIDVKSKKVIGVSVTTDRVHDNRRFRGLVRQASREHKIDKVAADAAYDDYRNYELLHRKKIRPVIKPKLNSNPDAWSLTKNLRKVHRLKQVLLFQKYGYDTWKKKTGYNYRTLNESVFSAFKAGYGDGVYSRKFPYARNEVIWKAYAYNLSH